ncbi:MAG: C40 family peptidase [Dysgonamonadaceae bacterium]|nr:C40 family peptidase [Dysgonamonadaceae bacterium]
MKIQFIFYFLFSALFLSSCGSSKNSAQRGVNKEVKQILEYAGNYTGVRYKAGGSTPKGFDCSGFTQYVFKKFNYRLPRTTGEQSRVGRSVKKKELRPGDLVFFTGKNKNSKAVGHVGIVVEANGKGNFLFIHASTSRGVTVSSDTESYYKPRYLSARRIVR